MRPKPAKATRILLAEDMEVNQFVATEILAREGYSCDIANTGREAVDAVARKEYDIVLMDCQMPEMSGFEATTAIRDRERESGRESSRLPIIALTASAVKGDRERCLAAGMDDYLTKPLNPSKLLRTIESFVKAREGSDATRPVQEELAAAHTVTSTPAPSAPNVEAAVDYPSLLSRCMGDAQLVRRVADKFQSKGPELWQQIVAGVKSGDAAVTARCAHAMKGTAANLSAVKLADLAHQLEQLGKAGDLATAEELVETLGKEFERCKRELHALSTDNAGRLQASQQD
jgi:CheY-like chemotaxis protein/HPt (histidine-containing phosphotransfer) domain-containing protein